MLKLLVTTIIFVNLCQKQCNAQTKAPYTLEEYFDGTFSVYTWNGTWLTDDAFLYRDSLRNYRIYNLTDNSDTVYISNITVNAFQSVSTVTLSKDLEYALIKYNVSSVFRSSTTAQYQLYQNVSDTSLYDELNPIHNGAAIQLAQFDNSGHGFAYVADNTLYYVANHTQIDNPVLVAEGQVGVIYCGVADWVYEEEVLGRSSALWFSPDSTKIAYAVFNDSNVMEVSYFVYGKSGNLNDQYPSIATLKYPKVGQANPSVKTYVYDILTHTTKEFQLISSIKNTEENNDYILFNLAWVDSDTVAMISTNRIQNESVIIRCDVSDGSCKEEISYKQSHGWLRPSIPLYSLDGTKKIEIIPQPQNDDYFDHLVYTNLKINEITRLTYGKRVVTIYYGWDEEKGLIYYGGNVNNTPSQQHVYVVNIANVTDHTCLTCSLVVDGEYCKYATGSFSKSFSYYARVCSGPNPAYVTLEKLKNYDGSSIVWQNNAKVREIFTQKLRPVHKDLNVTVGGNFTARIRMLLPPNLNESSKYPVIVNVYAGPNSNKILDSYSSGVENYFVTNRSYIYIFIDGRGSGRSGLNIQHAVYRNLGTVEIEDQITVMKYLQQSYSYIDATKTGIWGWSYGGFASTWALIKDTDKVFKFALAVAPVTSFIYYDTIYTERFMGLPTAEDNQLGYNNTDATRKVNALRDRLYFIIHGNADDNVHYQQSMTMMRALEKADIQFFQMSYPDENHSLRNVYKHLYHTLDKFFGRCFGWVTPVL